MPSKKPSLPIPRKDKTLKLNLIVDNRSAWWLQINIGEFHLIKPNRFPALLEKVGLPAIWLFEDPGRQLAPIFLSAVEEAITSYAEKKQNVAAQIRVWVRQHCWVRKTFHSAFLLALQTYWCWDLSTYDAKQEMWDLFVRKAALCKSYSKMVPSWWHWLRVCLGQFKETYISWMYLRTSFLHSAVGYALRADEHKDETASTGCWYWLPVNWNDKFSIYKARQTNVIKCIAEKVKKVTSTVAINGSGHFVVTNSVRELFLDFQECRGARI